MTNNAYNGSAEIREIYDRLVEISEREAMKLYRLAWKMERHGCSSANVWKCREEASRLHMNAFPERLLDYFTTWEYAFKF